MFWLITFALLLPSSNFGKISLDLTYKSILVSDNNTFSTIKAHVLMLKEKPYAWHYEESSNEQYQIAVCNADFIETEDWCIRSITQHLMNKMDTDYEAGFDIEEFRLRDSFDLCTPWDVIVMSYNPLSEISETDEALVLEEKGYQTGGTDDTLTSHKPTKKHLNPTILEDIPIAECPFLINSISWNGTFFLGKSTMDWTMILYYMPANENMVYPLQLVNFIDDYVNKFKKTGNYEDTVRQLKVPSMYHPNIDHQNLPIRIQL